MSHLARASGLPGDHLLIVQCCHLPHFFFAVEKLRARFPDSHVEAVLLDHPHTDEYLSHFPALARVHRWNSKRRVWIPAPPESSPERPLDLILPLLTRGYGRIKHAVTELAGARLWELDYRGSLTRLSRPRLRRSRWQALHPATGEFSEYLRVFPHRSLGKRVAILHSADASLIESSRSTWERLLREDSELIHLQTHQLLAQWRILRRLRPDSAVIFCSGQRGFWKLKILPALLGVPQILVVNENGHAFYLRARRLARFLYDRVRNGVAQPPLRPGIVFIQTEDLRHSIHALRQLRQPPLFPKSEVAVVCHERDRHHFEALAEVDRVIGYTNRLTEGWRVFREIRRFSPEIVSAVFSGRPVFRKQKLLFFLLGNRRSLAFNARLDCHWVGWRSLARLARHEPLLFPAERPSSPVRGLFIQTEDLRHSEHALHVLRTPKMFPQAELAVICHQQHRPYFESLPGVVQVIPYADRFSDGWRVFWRGRRFSPQFVSAIFSGRPIFWKQKFLFFLIGGFWKGFAFNASLDGYWVTLRTLPRILRREPLLFGETAEQQAEALLLQTEDDAQTMEAIRRMASEKVSGGKRISLLCSAEKRGVFQGMPELERIHAYHPSDWRANWRLLRRLWRTHREVVAAIYSGRPIFRFQKMLLFLLPADGRLVFNENLDCSYLTRSRIGSLVWFRQLEASQARGLLWLRGVLKVLLYVPRFLFLAAWLTRQKLKRARGDVREDATRQAHRF